MAEPPFDLKRAHRWFAVELNNLAWGYIEAASRSDEEAERMIHAAHGACFHWLEAGDLLNHLRAQNLLATAYATGWLPEAALRHARKCLELSEQAGDAQSAFDRAATHGCAAAAFNLANEHEQAQECFRKLTAAFDRLEDDDDRRVIDQLYVTPLSKR